MTREPAPDPTPDEQAMRNLSAGDPTDAAPRDVIPVAVQWATPVLPPCRYCHVDSFGHEPRCPTATTNRPPAPDPSPEEAAIIDRFGIYEREERMARVTKAINEEVHRAINRAWGHQ